MMIIIWRVETIQPIALLRLARILRRVWETCGDCCHSNSSEKLSASAGLKTRKGVNNNNDNE